MQNPRVADARVRAVVAHVAGRDDAALERGTLGVEAAGIDEAARPLHAHVQLPAAARCERVGRRVVPGDAQAAAQAERRRRRARRARSAASRADASEPCSAARSSTTPMMSRSRPSSSRAGALRARRPRATRTRRSRAQRRATSRAAWEAQRDESPAMREQRRRATTGGSDAHACTASTPASSATREHGCSARTRVRIAGSANPCAMRRGASMRRPSSVPSRSARFTRSRCSATCRRTIRACGPARAARRGSCVTSTARCRSRD